MGVLETATAAATAASALPRRYSLARSVWVNNDHDALCAEEEDEEDDISLVFLLL